MAKFPKQVFLKREKDGETSYLVSHDTLLAAVETGEKITVGVYRLVGTQDVEGVIQTRPMKKPR